MSIEVYKVIHVTGLLCLFLATGAIIVLSKLNALGNKGDRKIPMILHGVGLLLSLVGGFGMMARLGIAFPWPGWIWVKLIIWADLAIAPTWLKRRPLEGNRSTFVFFLMVALAAVAAYLALFKPF